jgi:Flp pilus assembly protein CpaB
VIRIIGAIVALLLAVAGGVVLFLYVQGADARAADGAEFKKVYVVTEAVPEGTTGEAIADFIKVDELPALSIQPDIVTDLANLAGLVTNAELLPGEQLLQARFSDPATLAAEGDVAVPEGLQEITIALPVERVVGGAVVPGSYVGVVYTTNTDSRASSTGITDTQFIAHRMLVTKVTPGSTLTSSDSEEDQPTEVSAFLVTLAVSTPDAELLAYAAEQQEDQFGGIWLTLEPDTADLSGSTRRNGENIFQ